MTNSLEAYACLIMNWHMCKMCFGFSFCYRRLHGALDYPAYPAGAKFTKLKCSFLSVVPNVALKMQWPVSFR